MFKVDLPHGRGLYVYPDGVKFKGCWKNGEQHGIGT
jgi:hypothetical protein